MEDKGDMYNKLLAKQDIAGVYSNLGQRDKALTIHKEITRKPGRNMGLLILRRNGRNIIWSRWKMLGQV